MVSRERNLDPFTGERSFGGIENSSGMMNQESSDFRNSRETSSNNIVERAHKNDEFS